MQDKEDSTEKNNNILYSSIIVENQEIVSRLGSANAEYVKGYSGVDQETQTRFKGLKDIAQSKVNPEFADQNIKQQAGFSAEIHKVSRDNARNIINKNSKRTIRTDDAPGFQTNDPQFDHVEILDGEVIWGSGSQMKFVGNYERLLNKINMGEGGGKNDFSRYQDITLDLPSEQVEPAKKYCSIKSQELRQKAERLEQKGQTELAEKCRKHADNFDRQASNIRDSGITTEDAVLLRKHPELVTAWEMSKTAHQAGIEGAKNGLIGGAAVSAGLNLLALTKGDLELDEALENISKDITKSTIMGYAGSAAGSLAKGAMQQSDYAIMRSLSKSALPGMLVQITVDVSKTISRLGKGEIDVGEALEELGQKGVNSIAGIWGATAGQILLPVPVLGAAVGATIACALSSLCFSESLGAIRQANVAWENYEETRRKCSLACQQLEAYKVKLHETFESYFSKIEKKCNDGLAIMENNISKKEFQMGINELAGALNIKLPHRTKEDINKKFNVFWRG